MRLGGCSKRGRSCQTPGVSRVSFLAWPVWLGRAQLSVQSGEEMETAVMLMAVLQVRKYEEDSSRLVLAGGTG